MKVFGAGCENISIDVSGKSHSQAEHSISPTCILQVKVYCSEHFSNSPSQPDGEGIKAECT